MSTSPPTAAAVFDMQSVANGLTQNSALQTTGVAFLDATQNADGSYTVANNGQVWAGPLSGANEYGSTQGMGGYVRFLNPYTGVIQIQLSGNNGAPPNGVPALNGNPQGYVQGQIVGWSGDSLLIKLYDSLNPLTGALGNPLASSATQTAYILYSTENLTATNGIPTSGATLGQPTDATTIASLQTNFGIYPTIPAAPVDPSGMVANVGANLNTTHAAWVQVTNNGNGTFSAAMGGVGSSYQAMSSFYDPTAYGIDIVATYPGGIVQLDKTLNHIDDGNFGYGKIVGWNQDGVLFEMYGTYSNGVLSNLASGYQQFIFLTANDLSVNPILSTAPEVIGQNPANYPANFGLALPSTATATGALDPASIANLNSKSFPFPGQGGFSSGQVVLADATQNADGSFTIGFNGEPWAGGAANPQVNGTDVKLSITVKYSNATNGAIDFTFAGVNGSTVPSVLSGEFFGKIVAWSAGDILIKLYSNLDPSTGALSGPVDPSQGPPYMVISSLDLGSTNSGTGPGAIGGMTLGQPTDIPTMQALTTNLAITQASAASAVDLSGLTAALNGLSTNQGAFVNAVNNNDGTYTLNAVANPFIPTSLRSKGIGYSGYSNFTDSKYGASTASGYTVQIANVYPGGVFQWNLFNPNPPSATVNTILKGQTTVDQFYAKVIGYDANGILVENYTTYSNGVLSGLVTGVQQYAFFSTNNLQSGGVTAEVVGQATAQLPTALGVAAGAVVAAPPSAAAVFDMQTVANGIANNSRLQTTGVAFLDATQNADGSYTVVNNGQVWAGPLSGANEYGSAQGMGGYVRFLNPYTGVIQIQLSGPTGAPPNGVPALNGNAQGYVQGQIVGWSGDSLLIKLYGALNPLTGALSNPLTSSATQTAYILYSTENLTATNGIPTSGATLGQPTDPTTIASLQTNFGIYPTIPAASVDPASMVTNVGGNLDTTHAAYVQVTNNGDGTFSAVMNTGLGSSYQALSTQYDPGSWNLDIVATYPGGIVQIDRALNHIDYGTLAYGKIIGWNQDGILFEMYGGYSDGTLTNLASGYQQFVFLTANDLSKNPILSTAPEVVGQNPANFPANFGLAPPPAPVQATLDPGSLASINGMQFPFPGQGSFSSGQVVLADATQNANGSFTIGFNGEPWAGGAANPLVYGTDVQLSITVKYSNAITGAIDFTFAGLNGSTVPGVLSGEFFGRIVGWNGGNVLLQLFSSVDQTTGALSGPVSSSQGPAYMLISARDLGSTSSGTGPGAVGGMTLGQPTNLATLQQLQANLGVSQISATSNVDVSGLPAALNGKSTDFGAFVSVSNLSNGAYSATDRFNPPVSLGSPKSSALGYNGYSDFTDNLAAADTNPNYTIKIDNVLGTGVFEWELDTPSAPGLKQYPTLNGATVIDHFFAKVIGFNADGILVENYASYSNGVLSNLAGGVTQYAYFSTNDLKTTDISTTPAQFSQDTTQLPNGLGVGAAVPCFATGTRIRTSRGDVAVEDLGAGDEVLTVSGVVRPVVWVGHRGVDCARHPEAEKVWPVRVASGAFGPDLPARDLYLSPDHALFVDGVLIPVKYLINGDTVAQVATDEVTYYHVELDSHDVLLAEDLPAESFLDTGNRDSFANGGASIRLNPDFAADWNARMWEAHACAPLVLCGPALDAARARLRQRADELAASSRVAA